MDRKVSELPEDIRIDLLTPPRLTETTEAAHPETQPIGQDANEIATNTVESLNELSLKLSNFMEYQRQFNQDLMAFLGATGFGRPVNAVTNRSSVPPIPIIQPLVKYPLLSTPTSTSTPPNSSQESLLEDFGSEECQYDERIRITNMRYDHNETYSMSEYFLKQAARFRRLTPPMSESLIVFAIMQQFPASIQSLWSAISVRTFDAALEFLRHQEALMPRRPKRSKLLVTKAVDIAKFRRSQYSATASESQSSSVFAAPFSTPVMFRW